MNPDEEEERSLVADSDCVAHNELVHWVERCAARDHHSNLGRAHVSVTTNDGARRKGSR